MKSLKASEHSSGAFLDLHHDVLPRAAIRVARPNRFRFVIRGQQRDGTPDLARDPFELLGQRPSGVDLGDHGDRTDVREPLQNERLELGSSPAVVSMS